MTPKHAFALTAGGAGLSVSTYLYTSEDWVALAAVGFVCLTLLAVVFKLAQNRGETKKN